MRQLDGGADWDSVLATRCGQPNNGDAISSDTNFADNASSYDWTAFAGRWYDTEMLFDGSKPPFTATKDISFCLAKNAAGAFAG